MPVYLLMYLVIFWIPVFILGWHIWKDLDGSLKKAFWITMAIMTVATFGMEFVYLRLNVWTFSEAIDPLLGIRLGGVPIEEFVFWFGVSPLFVFIYLNFRHLIPERAPTKNTHA